MKKQILNYFLYCFIHLACYHINAATPRVQNLLANTEWSFKENKGQLKDDKGKVNHSVFYYGMDKGVGVYCQAGKIGFIFRKTNVDTNKIDLNKTRDLSVRERVEDSLLTQQTITINRADMILLGSNIHAKIIASEQLEYYENYYTTGDANHGITDVHTYKTITYKSIYPSIDMVLHAKPQGMKYEFVVYPGGRVSDIQIEWKGLDEIKKNTEGAILYTFPLGEMKETSPVSFQGQTKVNSSFILKDQIVSFDIPNFQSSEILVIDPIISWGTYFGTNLEFGNAIKTDTFNNVYISGYTSSATGIATNGAYQTVIGGSNDSYIAKFSILGNLLWSTYYGGSNPDASNGITISDSNEIYIVGLTRSTSGIATAGAYQQSISSTGYWDLFLAKFDINGVLQWGTYYGGKLNDAGRDVKTDYYGNVYITGSTYSDSGISTLNTYQTTFGGGTDVFLVKLSSNGNVLWGTYFGGLKNEDTRRFVVDDSGNVYLFGETYSTTGIATNGAYQTIHGGSFDVFLAKFSNIGNIDWSTYFGGSDVENSYGIVIDSNRYIYISGLTRSTTNISTIGASQTNINGMSDAYLTKFDSSGAVIWSTYHGGNNLDHCEDLTMDKNGIIYMVGQTISSAGIASSGATQANFGGSNDAFLTKFSHDGKPKWGTYYGGNAVDGVGCKTTVDQTNNVYITGTTTSKSGMTTQGAFQSGFSGTQIAYLTQFNFDVSNDASIQSIIIPNNPECGGVKGIKINLKNYGKDTLKSVRIYCRINGTPLATNYWSGNLKNDSSTIVNIGSFNFDTSGFYSVKVWTYRPNNILDSIPENDTQSIQLYMYMPVLKIQKNNSICIGDSLYIGDTAISTNKYYWTSIPTGFTDTISNPLVYPITTTKYLLTITDRLYGCSKTDSVLIKVNLTPQAIVGKDTKICMNDSIQIGSYPFLGNTYSWFSLPLGFNSNNANPFVKPTQTTKYILVERNNLTGCSNTDTVQIIVNSKPKFIAGMNKSICEGESVYIGDTAVSKYKYNWTSNPIGYNDSNSNPKVSPILTTTYILTVTDTLSGCSLQDSVKITVNQTPIAYPGIEQKICLGDSVGIGAKSILGNKYLWISHPNGFNDTISNPTVSPKQTTTYILTETTSSGCSKTDSVTITVIPTPQLSLVPNKTICQLDSVTIGTNSIKNCKYAWSSLPVGYFDTTANPKVSPMTTKKYLLLVTDTLTNCSTTDSVLISVNVLPQAMVGNGKAICSGDNIQIGGIYNANNKYNWSSRPIGFSNTSSKPTVSPSIQTTYILKETIVATGCSKTDSVIIQINPLPKTNAGNDQMIFVGDLVGIGSASNIGSSYSWKSIPTGFSSSISNPQVSPIVNTIYILSEINQQGCKNTDTVKVSLRNLGIDLISSNDLNMEIFPNPGSSVFNLNVDGTIASNAVMCIYDVTGKELYCFKVQPTQSINLSNEPSGIYMVKLISGDTMLVKKIMKL